MPDTDLVALREQAGALAKERAAAAAQVRRSVLSMLIGIMRVNRIFSCVLGGNRVVVATARPRQSERRSGSCRERHRLASARHTGASEQRRCCEYAGAHGCRRRGERRDGSVVAGQRGVQCR